MKKLIIILVCCALFGYGYAAAQYPPITVDTTSPQQHVFKLAHYQNVSCGAKGCVIVDCIDTQNMTIIGTETIMHMACINGRLYEYDEPHTKSDN